MNDTGVFLAPLMTVNNVGMAWHEPRNQRRHDFMDCRSGLILSNGLSSTERHVDKPQFMCTAANGILFDIESFFLD